jgi:amino acid transporter
VPRRAILLSFSIIVFMGLFDFDTILGVDNFLSALSSLVEMSAAVKMRFSHPEIERPYKVALSDKSLAVMMVLPFCVGCFIMVNELTKSALSFWLNVAVLVFGVFCQKWIKRHPYHAYDAVLDVNTPRHKDLTIEY